MKNVMTEFTTPFGGAVSLFLRVLIIWYLVLNARKMLGKEDAALSEVSQSLNLLDPATPEFNAREHYVKIGVAAHYTDEVEVCNETGSNCEKKSKKFSLELDDHPFKFRIEKVTVKDSKSSV
jgi:hypothetical protein